MKTKYKFIFVLFTVLFLKTVCADSFETLHSKWKNATVDTTRINNGLRLVKQYYLNSEDSIFKSTELLLEIYKQSKKIGFNQGLIESSFYLGNCYTLMSKPNIAVEYYYLSLKKAESIKDYIGIAKAKMGIGLVYYSQNNWTNAIEFFKGSLLINKKFNEEKRVSTQQYLIGISYNNLNKFIIAKAYLDSAIFIKNKIGDLQGIYECYMGIAEYFKGINQTDTAIRLYNILLQKYISEKESIPVSLIYSSLAQIYLEEGNTTKAFENSQKAIEYSEMSKIYSPKLKAREITYRVYLQMKDYKKSLNYYIKYQSIKDSIENKDFISQISIANAQYNFEKEQNILKMEKQKLKIEHENEIKNKNRRLAMLIAILFILFLVAIIIIVAYRGLENQKRISEKLLLNILPVETANELKKLGKSLPKIHKSVTIMFCDVKNFSNIAEKLTPEEVVEMLDTYFKQFDRIIQQFNIEKIKTIGDAYMCVSGLNTEPKQSAVNCVKAAIEILKFNSLIENSMLEKFNHAFYFRIGIHTGNVVSGVVGEKKYSYDIWGDAVNIAARMEQNSEAGFINISESTHELIYEYFDCINRGIIPIKNKGAVAMYFVNIT